MLSTPTLNHRCPESIDGAIALVLNQHGGLTIDGVRHTTILSAMATVCNSSSARLQSIGQCLQAVLGDLVCVTCDYDRQEWQHILASDGSDQHARMTA